MRVGIVGSRNYTDKQQMWDEFAALTLESGEVTVVSGGADGADTLAKEIAAQTYSGYIEHLPNRSLYGWPTAAFERNTLIVNDCDVLMAFFGPDQPPMRGDRKFGSGTMDTVQKAMRQRKPVHIYFQKESI